MSSLLHSSGGGDDHIRGALHGIDDLLDQYIAIVKARRQLLDADLPELACKYDLGKDHLVQPVSLYWLDNDSNSDDDSYQM